MHALRRLPGLIHQRFNLQTSPIMIEAAAAVVGTAGVAVLLPISLTWAFYKPGSATT